MNIFDRIINLIRSNLTALVSSAEDPEKILEQSVLDMQEQMVQLRQAVAQSIATLKRQEQQYNQAGSQALEWERRAMLALQKNDEDLAREALNRKKDYAKTATSLKTSIDQQSGQVDALKRNLVTLEGKISEARTKKDMLKARIQSAKAQENLNNMLSNVNTNSAAALFERVESQVLDAESRASAAAELGMDDLENKFAALESGGSVDDELAALKAKMLNSSTSLPAIEPQDLPGN